MKPVLLSFIFSLILLALSTGFQQKQIGHRFQLFVFEGSDWCTNCRKLERTVLKDTTFLRILHKQQIELIRVDFPQRTNQSESVKQQNQKLADEYGFDGQYPGIVLARTDTFQFSRISFRNQSALELSQEILNQSQKWK
ncbi:MAG TPA: thioredoxin family protein [Catalimonadaceae bacterium]|nr:thioredoxin family protein [Catalimonadaceae bacterium]